MRIAASLGVLVATGLLGHVGAQVTDYGNPNGSPVGNPPDGSGNNIPGNTDGMPGSLPYPSNAAGTAPGSLPSGTGPISPGSGGLPPNGPGGAPGDVPGSLPGNSPSNVPGTSPGNVPGAGSAVIPGSFPTNAPQNIPGSPGSPGSSGSPGFPGSPDVGASNIPTCPLRSTKTVVVTVYPTESQNESDFPWPDESEPEETTGRAPLPTKPAEAIPLTSGSVVAPFTTLTLDIWGPGGSPSSSGTGADDGTDSDVGNNSGDDSDNGTSSNDGNDPDVGNSSDSDGENGSQDNPDSPFFSPTPGSGNAPDYSGDASDDSSVGLPGASGANTQAPAPTPFQTSGPPSNGGVPGNQPQYPSSGPVQEASDSLPVTTQAGPQGQGDNSPWFTNVPGGDGAGQPSPSFITITGPDGLPTVVSSGDNVVPGQEQPPSTSGSPQNGNDQGLPGGVPSGVPLPLPVSTGVPGSQGPSNSPAGPLSGSGPAGGITTCATLTITGTDGLPTVVDSTWVIPFNTPVAEDSSQLPVTGIPQGTLSGIPIDVGSIPTAPVPAPGSPQDGSGSLAMTTCTSYTIIGADGLPTVVHSTWAIPAATPGSGDPAGLPGSPSTGGFLTVTGLSTFGPSGISGTIPTASGLDNTSPITTCTSYTVIGTDGLPTIVDSTWVIPGPANTGATVSGGPNDPSEASDALPNGATSGATIQTSGATELPSSGPSEATESGVIGSEAITACTSYTIIGPNGLPTVVDSTWVIPGSVDTQSALPEDPSFVSDSIPSGLPTGIPGQVTASPSLPSDGDQGNMPGLTTCITYTIIGTDGLPTVVDSTFLVSTGTATPTGTGLTLPSITSDTQAVSSLGSPGTFTTLTTAVILGPDGKPTSTVQTVVFSDSSALAVSAGVPEGTVSGITSPAASGPVFTTGDLNSLSTGVPSLNGYDNGNDNGISDEPMSAIITDGSADAQGTSATGTTTGTFIWTVTSVINPSDGPVFSSGAAQPPATFNPSGDGASDQLPQTAYGSVASESTLWPLSAGPTTLQTTTWTNVIKAGTTSYTINYPLTTLATITVPGKSRIRRQEMSAWSNSTTSATSFTQTTSLGASLSSALSSSDATSSTSSASTATSSEASSPTICAAGGSIGNTTIDFDNSKPGPLFNPVENIWFSGGFIIAPPTSQQPQPYIPSSGGQLVEFVPPALSNTTTTISGDVAQIGVGPHAASPCFRFDFFGANLGCDAHGDERWCEFEVSAYRWNETSSSEESIAWSETKQVPACPKFSEGGYELTRVDLDGYKDLSSVLITLRVSSDLRVWWGDDFRVGWSDNSCIAASCRTNVPSQFVKRETVLSALRQGVYQWAPHELKRLDDGLVWESAN
ncbi:hypothetical protein FSARC_6721 [Fusarium sarcochroum]|uniref:DUF7371 domain-containing protein n=1 Tax=Fusarium sarcochroum TaxID=1208366 RepID=A0A8H4TWJ7_9HYPO|nr:hypothetical protein FSARC_6721 [Fusarium sarcochroum]